MLLLLFCAAPPLPDPLPLGAVARLGLARMVAPRHRLMEAERDGLSVRLALWDDEGESRSRWLRLADARDITPLSGVCRVFPDGSRLRREGKRYFLQPKGGALRFVAETHPPVFSPDGKSCARVDPVEKDNLVCGVLHFADLSGGGPVRWRRVAEGAFSHSDVLLSRGRVLWMQREGEDCHRWGVHAFDPATGKTASASIPKGYAWPALSPDGTRFLLRSEQGVRFFDAATVKLVRKLRDTRCDEAVFTPDGASVAVLAAGRLQFLPLDPKVEARSIPLLDASRIAFFPDGKRFAVQGVGDMVRVHDSATGKQLDPHSRYPAFDAVSLVGGHEAIARAGPLLVRWDIRTGRETGRCVLRLADGEMVERLAFGPGGKSAAGILHGKGGFVAETATGRILARFDAHEGHRSASIHPSGKDALFIPPIAESRYVLRRRGFDGKTLDADFPLYWHGLLGCSPDGRFVVLANEAAVQAAELATGKERWAKYVDAPERAKDALAAGLVAFDRRGRRVVVVHGTSATLFDLSTGERLASIPDRSSGRNMFGDHPPLASTGRWLASACEGRVRLWDMEAKFPSFPVLDQPLPCRRITGLALADGRLVTSHDDGTCLVWDIAALKRADAAGWAELGDSPAEAIAGLLRTPARTVRLLSSKLAAVPFPPKEAGRWIEALGADGFRERTEAEEHLAAHREACEGLMRAALAGATIEPRKRLERILKPLDERSADPSWLRRLRAVEVLERIGTEEARAVLERLAKGAPGAALTVEAKAALERTR